MSARGPIGRYRVIRLLGSGGMGEVFEAYDDQLQRSVAIKGLLGGQARWDRRERLRREALSAAALSHPAITHVYEIVTEGDTDWVVMEYVEGRSLADVVTAGPLPGDEVARIGVEVAEALAEAHRRGIVHRDIKTENVLLTPTGHVKVLDFGLAKWTGSRAAADDRITTDGLVVGTSRAMSPEQALGQDVDARSDIFSLGSMLYELAAGKPAFRGASAIETMNQVAAAAFQPLAEASPDLAPELAAVIERCLTKGRAGRYSTADALAADLRRVATSVTGATAAGPAVRSSQRPARSRVRWRWAAAGIAVLTAAAVAALWFGLLAPRKPLTVAVLPMVTQTPAEDVRLASAAVADAIASYLTRLNNVIVVSSRDVRAVATGGKRIPDIARELGVKELVEASFTEGEPGAPARLVVSRLDANGTLVWSDQLEVGTDDLPLLEDRITTALADGYLGFSAAHGALSRNVTPDALRAFLEAQRRLDDGRYSKDLHEVAALLEQAVAISPRFLDPLLKLASLHRYRFDMTQDPRERDAAADLLVRARAVAPADPRVAKAQVEFDISAGAFTDAERHARALVASRPGDPEAWQQLSLALQKLNRFGEAEKAMQRAIALQPAYRFQYDLADLRTAQGDTNGARRVLEAILAQAPDNVVTLARLSYVEINAGDYARVERICRKTVALRGSSLDYNNLGTALFYQHRPREAVEAFQKAVALAPKRPANLSNLADAYFWSGDIEAATRTYRSALALCDGLRTQGSYDASIHVIRALCLAHLGRGAEAVLESQAAIEQSPRDAYTAFTAAVVAALNGDTQACLAWTQMARQLKSPPEWFSGPEFAALRSNRAFVALVPASARAH